MSKPISANRWQRFAPVLLLILACALTIYKPLFAADSTSTGAGFSGAQAMAFTRHAVSFGERSSGSPENLKLRQWITSQLKPLGAQFSTDDFIGHTPTGNVSMQNLILKFPGTSGRAIAVTGHFDTKKIPLMHFVGANDGGSSTGFLVEFARVAAHMPHRDDIYVVFFDGEEAVGEWTRTDSVYGSRHLASKWAGDGTLARLVALINVDMIGDKSLDVLNDANSAKFLRDLTLETAARLGDSIYFQKDPSGIDDDHMPFAEAGVSVLDLIDFNYGANNEYWHQPTDTMDKLSEHSLQVVGDVVVAMVKELDRRP